MPPIVPSYEQNPDGHDIVVSEAYIEEKFIEKLKSLKYTHRRDIHSLESLEANFRAKFEQLNAVTLSDSEFARLLDLITTPDVYKSAEILRGINAFERDDGTPLNYTLVNIKDWCKNDYEIVSQLRINTRSSFHRYDVILLINGFTGTPIFEQNATAKQIDGEEASYKTTEDIFQQALHKYTITHAIEDKNVLKFHIDYFKDSGRNGGLNPTPPSEPDVRVSRIRLSGQCFTPLRRLAASQRAACRLNRPSSVKCRLGQR